MYLPANHGRIGPISERAVLRDAGLPAHLVADIEEAFLANAALLAIAKAVGELSLGDRMELERWREECAAMLSQVADG